MANLEVSAAGQASAQGNIVLHSRTKIRDAVATLLKAEVGGAWTLVYQSRIDYPRDVWPYLKVYTDREDVQRISIHSPHAQQRTLSLNVVAMVRVPAGETESVEDKMDAFALTIEGLLTDEAMRGEMNSITSMDLLSSSMDVVLNQDDKISHAELTMNYQIRYQTFEGMPDGFV